MVWNKINIFKKKEKSSEIYFSDDKNSFEQKDERKLEYEKAKKEYIDNTMNQAKQVHSWKMAFMLTFILMMISICYSFYLASRSTLIPYVIEVDETGNAKGINPVYEIAYNPSELTKEYFIRKLIYNSRTITLDNVTNGAFYTENMYFLSPVAKEKYHIFLTQDELTEKIKNGITRKITIVSLNKIAGTGNSYQARWNEESFDSTGNLFKTEKMLGTFILKASDNITLESARFNPLGIIIEDYILTKES